MNIDCLSSLCACYAEAESSETMTDINVMTSNSANGKPTPGEKNSIDGENQTSFILDVNGNPVRQRSNNNSKLAGTGLTRTTGNEKSSVAFIGKNTKKIEVEHDNELCDVNANPAASVRHNNNVHI